MLVKKDLQNRKNSIYECDRCKNKMNVYGTQKLYVQTADDLWPKKKYDFCKRCYKSMVRGVENGRSN